MQDLFALSVASPTLCD